MGRNEEIRLERVAEIESIITCKGKKNIIFPHNIVTSGNVKFRQKLGANKRQNTPLYSLSESLLVAQQVKYFFMRFKTQNSACICKVRLLMQSAECWIF